jgi:tetratricopeptide (TPR) repeat protein
VKRELRSLPTGLAEAVGKHLLMVGRLIDDDTALALQHAERAHRLASRVACVRETLAIAAYANDDYRTALRESRTVRRMTGDDTWLPMIADCERGLGRPERALDTLREADLPSLEPAVRAESLIVLAGARRDLGQVDAALHALEDPLLRSRTQATWLARMRLAYADLLAEAGRDDESTRWLRLAEAADPDGTTVDPEALSQLLDIEIVDVAADPDVAPAADPDGSVIS